MDETPTREDLQDATAELYHEQATLMKGVGLVSADHAQALEHLASAYMQFEIVGE